MGVSVEPWVEVYSEYTRFYILLLFASILYYYIALILKVGNKEKVDVKSQLTCDKTVKNNCMTDSTDLNFERVA